MPNQHSAPVPQDIHPQHYQAAGVGAPPGHQWGVPAPQTGPLGPGAGPSATVPDWNRRLAAMDSQPQPLNQYDPHDVIRPPPQPRQPSPRPEHMRQYQEPHRHTPVRRPSPSPSMPHINTNPYAGAQALPQPALPPAPQTAPTRIANPNYGALNANIGPPNGAHPGPIPPIGRGGSPPPEIPPLANERVPSPGGAYPHPAYHSSHPSQPGGIASGGPPPTAALAAAEAAAAREREERPSTGFKRMVEPEDDYKIANKKPSNGDSRSRLEDHHYRRGSPIDAPRQPQVSSPVSRHRRSSSELRREDQRRQLQQSLPQPPQQQQQPLPLPQQQPQDVYHPSDAAHHPTLPSISHHQQQQQQQDSSPLAHPGMSSQSQPQPHQQQPPHLPQMTSEPQPPLQSLPPQPQRDERREAFEPAARKMDMDEDYDDDGEEDKKASPGGRGVTKLEPQG